MAHPLLLLIVVEILVSCGNPVNGNVFSSTSQLRMLAEGEVELIAALKSYVSSERQKLDELNRLVAEVEEVRTPLLSGVNHPVDAFRLLQRFTTTWKREILWLIYDSAAIEEVKSVVDSLRKLLPSDDDYEGAKLALIRLQKVYELNVADVINGTILDHTTRPMTQQMAVDVAMFALDRNMTDDGLLWLTHAQTHPIPPLTSLQDIYHATSRIHEQKEQFVEAEYFAEKALKMDPTNVDYLLKVLVTKSGQTTKSHWEFHSNGHYHLCRQYLVQNTFRSDGTLSCFYERGRHNPMLRTKVEMLFRSPDIILIHDFVTVNESVELRRIAMSQMKPALTGHFMQSVSEDRVATVAWLHDDMGESLVDRILKRIFEATGLGTKPPFAEPLQVANYGMAGHYDSHMDNFHHHINYEHIELFKWTNETGDRIATFLIYLNDVAAGGATVFPLLDLGIRPVQNAAVLWYNYKRSGFGEPLVEHAGCPVLIGEKWVANKWIREFGQVFLRPCDLSIEI